MQLRHEMWNLREEILFLKDQNFELMNRNSNLLKCECLKYIFYTERLNLPPPINNIDREQLQQQFQYTYGHVTTV